MCDTRNSNFCFNRSTVEKAHSICGEKRINRRLRRRRRRRQQPPRQVLLATMRTNKIVVLLLLPVNNSSSSSSSSGGSDRNNGSNTRKDWRSGGGGGGGDGGGVGVESYMFPRVNATRGGSAGTATAILTVHEARVAVEGGGVDQELEEKVRLCTLDYLPPLSTYLLDPLQRIVINDLHWYSLYAFTIYTTTYCHFISL